MSLAGRLLLALLVLAWSTLVGWCLTRLFAHGLSRFETAGWSLATGLFVQACLFALLLLVGLVPGPRKLGLVDLLLVGGSLALRNTRGPSRAKHPPRRAWTLVFLVPVLVVFAVSILDFVAQPIWATDAVAIWGFKAKTIFLTSAIPQRLFADPETSWSHPEYPLLVPLQLASVAAFLRRFDDQALALVDAALEAATILVVAGFLRRRISLLAGGTGAILTASCLFLYRGANAGTAEIPLALALALLSTALLDFEQRDDAAVRTRLLAASLLCVTTKQEGTLFVLLAFASTAVFRLRRRHTASVELAAACLLPPLIAQVAAVRLLTGGINHRDYDLGLLAPTRLSEWMPRLRAVLSHLATVEVSGSALALAALTVFFLVTRPTTMDRLLPVLLLQVSAYVAAATLSWWGAVWSLETSFARITMTLFPSFTLVLGARMGGAARRSGDRA